MTTTELRMALTPEEIYERLRPYLDDEAARLGGNREVILEELRQALACQVCGGKLTSFCPSCRGRAGGSRTSPAKVKAAKRARKVGEKRKRETGEHQ